MYDLVINENAYLEIEEAYHYYFTEASPLIAERFNQELNQAYEAIKLNPKFQTRSGKFKGFPLKEFPFILFFEIIETKKEIKLLAVFNTYKDSEKWPK